MEYDIRITPTYSECGSLITIIIDNVSGKPMGKPEIVEALREFAIIFEEHDEGIKN